MEFIVLNPGLVYARLVWFTHSSGTSYKNWGFDNMIPHVDHLVHFKNDLRHNIERIKII